MRQSFLRGHLFLESGPVLGSIGFSTEEGDAARIEHIEIEQPIDHEAVVRESDLPIIVPGFIDLHVHGARGRDVMEGDDAAIEVAQAHARYGTTALLATTMTAPAEDLEDALTGVARALRQTSQGARILGVHLEGPYIHPDKLGAQPAFTRGLSFNELTRLDAIAKIRVITLAPEAITETTTAIAKLVAMGFVVQLGHSNATYEQGREALERGARGFTHLFNAMSPLHHRAPGLVGAALAHAEFAEIIVDLLHLHPGAIRTAIRSIPHCYCVTDGTSATTMADGNYRLGRQTVIKCGGGVRLEDGTLAGSTLTMDQAFRNLVEHVDVSLSDAVRLVSTNAADYLGLTNIGRLAQGASADAVIFDRDLRLTDVIVRGQSILQQ